MDALFDYVKYKKEESRLRDVQKHNFEIYKESLCSIKC